MEPIHLRPTAELAERVLLPGDPGRALHLAQVLLESPRMFNHARGLWGYTGAAADGRPLTVQSTGMGGPSAAIVASELIQLGARRLIRVGTCGALAGGLELGSLLAVSEALCADGTSRALGAGASVLPDAGLLAGLEAEAEASGVVASTDLFYDRRALEPEWRAAGAVAVEMEAATLLALAAGAGVRAAAILIVTDLVLPTRQRIGDELLRAAETRLGLAALAALAPAGAA